MEMTTTNTDSSGSEIKKRNVAFRLRIGDILKGKPVSKEGKFIYLDLNGKNIVRVNLLANCIDKFIQDGEKKYASLTIDDASGQIRIKAFGDDIELLKKINQGDTLQIIGNVREWNAEVYLLPEVVKAVDPRWLLVRKLEIQKQKKDLPVSQETSLKELILQQIRDAEVDGGIDRDKILMDLEASPEKVKEEIKKLLEEGLIYEPRPERLRYLG